MSRIPGPRVEFMVLWQSLVMASYRSLWRELSRLGQCSVSMVGPEIFREGGMRDVLSQVNDARNPPLTILPVKKWHTQAVWFRGLTMVLYRWLRKSDEKKIFLCFAEPYAITSIFAIISLTFARMLSGFRGQKPLVLFYGFQNIYKNFSWPIRFAQTLIFRCCDAILVPGLEHETVLRRHGYVGRCIKFPMWFDPEVFYWGKTISSGPIQIGYAGSLLHEKGIFQVIDYLIHHPSLLKDNIFKIVGAGELQEEIENKCRTLRSGGYDVQFLGATSSAKIADFFRSIDILIVPSRTSTNWKEQFGRVIIEGAACGCVVIGSNSGELPNVIGNLERIFGEDDLNDFERVLSMAISLVREQRSTIKRTMSEWAYARYSDAIVAKKLSDDLIELGRNFD